MAKHVRMNAMVDLNSETVRAVLMDCDGVLSDGGLIYCEPDTESKIFHVHDGRAIKAARAAGLQIGIVSGREGPVLRRRATELGCAPLLLGVGNKAEAVAAWLASASLDWSQLLFIGDDLPDIECVRFSGLGVAVADAVPALRRIATMVTRLPGGHGAVAEVLERLLRGRRPPGNQHA